MEQNPFAVLKKGAVLNNGRYVIEEKLGQGTFGITYRAKDINLGRLCAIKESFNKEYNYRDGDTLTVRHSGISDEAYAKKRQDLINEAQRLARLDHPGVVKVWEQFEENNTTYMVMEFINGKSLKNIIGKEGRLDYERAVNYLAQITEAVDYIHGKEILHRDIKPDNVMITPDHRAILIDFGAARGFIHDKTQVFTKAILTAHYAPCEQYSAKSRIGSYTDIYAIGATFYHMVTGAIPTDAMARRDGEVLPEPKALNPELSDAVNHTILTAMAELPQNRYQTVVEFWDDLLGKSEKYRELEPKPQPPVRSYKKLLLIAGIIVVLIGAVAAWQVPKMTEFNTLTALADADFQDGEFASAIEKYNETKGSVPLFKSVNSIDQQIERSRSEIQRLLPEMVLVGGGSFTMGATSEQGSDYTDSERPIHNVSLNAFRIGKYEVTQREWKAVMSNNPSDNQGDDLPVENVSWDMAQRYIQALNRKTGKKYRLPTEAEWEYASRGGQKSGRYKYSGSNNVSEVAWFYENTDNTRKVGTRKANELGIYDMSGNVFEWCQDWASINYSGAGSNNPTGPESGSARVIRGGCFAEEQSYCRVSMRYAFGSSAAYNYVGFRLAQDE